MNIGVVELDHHRECLHSLCQLLHEGDHKVSVFTTRNIFSEISDYPYAKDIQWHICDSGISQFILSKQAEFNQQELLIFSTVESQFKTYNRITISVPKLVRVHNANTFLGTDKKWFFKPSLYWLYKDLSYYVRKVIVQNETNERDKFLYNADFICFTSSEITDFVRNKSSFKHKEKVVDAIPITFNELPPKDIAAVKSIAVIGTIDRKRKNYNLLRSALGSVAKRVDRSFEIKILGKPKGAFGREMVNQFLQLRKDGLRVSHWPKGVPQVEFEKQMKEVDVIVAPILEETKYFLSKENYGLTKISGSINDTIKYARLGIVPGFYPLGVAKPLFRTYDSSEKLENILMELLEGRSNASLNTEDLEPFSLKATAQSVNRQLKEILKNN